MTFRPATLADADALTELATTTMREAFGPPYNPIALVDDYIASAITLPILQGELTDPSSVFFVMEAADGSLAGYAKLRRHAPPRRMTQRRAIEIQRIYLLQKYIGQGAGAQLMNHCLEYARSKGFLAVWLGVWERNARAISFYQKIGFTRFSYHYFQFGAERQRDYWFAKSL